MYFKHWGLTQAPFDNVPDPKMYWPRNPCLEDAISEILFAVEEGNECLAVIVGDIGTGKTLALRVLLGELNPRKYKVAFLTNPTLTFTQILREIVGQLENRKIATRWKDRLQEEFNQILYNAANGGKRIVVFIDEANVLSTSSLQDLRLLTNMQDDRQNLVTFVLAGQKELAQKLEKPSMENLYQRIGVYCKVKGLDSPEMVKEYIDFRIKQAGGSRQIFTREAIRSIWKHSHGTPRMVNKICKLCLKAGETNRLAVIDESLVENLAYMFKKGFFVEKEPVAVEVRHEEEPQSESGTDPEILEVRASEDGPTVEVETVAGEPEVTEPVTEVEKPEGPGIMESDRIEVPQEPKAPDPVDFASKRTENIAVEDLHPDPEPDLKEVSSELDELLKQVPHEVLERLGAMGQRQMLRLAGQLAAKQLRENQNITNGGDPILYWEKMRNEIAVMLYKFSKAGYSKTAEFM
ncbi:MAG: AAA family ATPase [Pseudomonadota bacterium]